MCAAKEGSSEIEPHSLLRSLALRSPYCACSPLIPLLNSLLTLPNSRCRYVSHNLSQPCPNMEFLYLLPDMRVKHISYAKVKNAICRPVRASRSLAATLFFSSHSFITFRLQSTFLSPIHHQSSNLGQTRRSHKSRPNSRLS